MGAQVPGFYKSADCVDPAVHWTRRVTLASMPTTTGAIVRAVLGKNPDRGVALGTLADIRPDGIVVTLIRKNGVWGGPMPLGHAHAVRDNFRRLADHCRLSDAERSELFEELRKWIRKDYRARSEN